MVWEVIDKHKPTSVADKSAKSTYLEAVGLLWVVIDKHNQTKFSISDKKWLLASYLEFA